MQRLPSSQPIIRAFSAKRCVRRRGSLGSILLNSPCCNGAAPAVLASATAREIINSSSMPNQFTAVSFSSSPLSSPSPSSFLSEDGIIDSAPLPSDTHQDIYENAINHTHQNTNHGYSHQHGYGKIVALSSQSSPSSPISTYFTDLRHSSPMRLVPSRRSHPTHQHQQPQQRQSTKHEAALLHLSSYGGGLVPGDSLDLDVDICGHGTVVCILTQGGQRIYRPGEQRFRRHDSYKYDTLDAAKTSSSSPNIAEGRRSKDSQLCKSTIQCTIEPGSTLFYLPDPTVPYYQSSFQERREFTCQYSSKNNDVQNESLEEPSMGSIVAVDWYSSGRRYSTGMEEERWAFDYLATRTELFFEEQKRDQTKKIQQDRAERRRPAVIESMILDNKLSDGKRAKMSTSAAIALGRNLDAMATLLLHGPSSLPVAKRAESLSRRLASLCTRTRSGYSFGDNPEHSRNVDNTTGEVKEFEDLLGALGGKVLLSVTPVKHDEGCHHRKPQLGEQLLQTHMVRILAESNEDVYRILHFCLKPCSHYLGGLEPYRDRIHSSRTVIGNAVSQQKQINSSAQTALRQRQERADKDQQNIKRKHPNLQTIANQLVFGKHNNDDCFSSEAWFRLCTLSDSSLPVGSFAHSLGVEAASQMGVFVGEEWNAGNDVKRKWSASDSGSSCSAEALSDYLHAVSRSNARFSTPLILAGYSLVAPASTSSGTVPTPLLTIDAKHIHQSWLDIDAYIDSLLRSNGPGRRASMDQGLGLLRIAPSFKENIPRNNGLLSLSTEMSELWDLIRQSIDRNGTISNDGYPKSHSPSNTSVLSNSDFSQSSMANGHAAPIYGILSASLGIPPLDACRVFAFGATRDTVSAAVRLNLVGPVAGLSILDGVGRGAVEEGLEEGLVGMLRDSFEGTDSETHGREYITREEKLEHWLDSVATCAPVLDTVQPLHDLLSVRLFRT